MVRPAYGRLAQLAERLVYTEKVGGSIPSSPTIRRRSGLGWRAMAGAKPAALVAVGMLDTPWGVEYMTAAQTQGFPRGYAVSPWAFRGCSSVG